LLAERDAIADCLAGSGIEVIALKGAHLLTLYPTTGARPVGDLDLLVRRTDLQPTIAILQGEGFGPRDVPPIERILARGKMPDLRRPDGLPVDLHWRIKGGGEQAAKAIDAVWERSRPLPQGFARGLDPVDALAYTVLHLGASHAFGTRNGLAGLADIAVLLDAGVDADQAVNRAVRWGLRRAALIAMLLARDLMGARVPQAAIERLQVDGWEEAAHLAVRRLLHPHAMRSLFITPRPTLVPPPGASGLMTREGRNPARLARYLKRAALPPAEDLALEFRGVGNAMAVAYPLHWAQLAVAHLGIARLLIHRRGLASRRAEDRRLRTWIRAA
jgi:hypothetical protein